MFFECIFLYVFCFYRVEFVGFVMKLETLRLRVGSKNPQNHDFARRSDLKHVHSKIKTYIIEFTIFVNYILIILMKFM